MDLIKKATSVILIYTISIFYAVAARETQEQQAPDSIRLDEVIVTGRSFAKLHKTLPMTITVVNQQQIRDRLEPSVLPLLTEEVPGLYITQRGAMGYGVSNGSAGGMSIRGIGGSPTSGVLVLIDGHPQFMGLMGHPLADSYQSASAERVEVVSGPASTMYGSNAMGGVINIITKKQMLNGLKQSHQIMYGIYNTLSANVSAQYRKDKAFAYVDLSYNGSDGHRQDMEFAQKNIYTKLGYDINDAWSSFIDFNLSDTSSSNPGMTSNPLKDNDADTKRGAASIVIDNRYKKSSGSIRLYYNFGSHLINDGYPADEEPKTYRFHSNDDMMGVSVNQSYSFFAGNKSTIGIDYQRFGGRAIHKYTDKRDDSELIDIHLNDIAGYFNIQQNIAKDKATLNAGVRIDHHETNGSEWIPQFSLNLFPTSTSSLKLIASKGFRNPTIRELHMFPPSNPNLLPERLMNYEISATKSLMNESIILGANIYYIKGDNIIQTEMIEGKPLNTNTGAIENKGFEITATYQVNSNLMLNANYSYLHMKKKVIAAPEHKLYMGAQYSKQKWALNTGLQYIANLYTSVGQNPSTENYLNWNARIKYKLNKYVSIFVKGDNILNQQYEINKGFPMPGTTLHGGCIVNI